LNNGSGTAGDWAVAVNEKANVKTELHDKAILANLEQFLMPMGTTFPAGTLFQTFTSFRRRVDRAYLSFARFELVF
jgi:hypothetical protein